mgnify:CR=1 FL=1
MILKYNITSSRMSYFTDAQAAKVDAGVEILKQIVCDNFRGIVVEGRE